MPKTFHNVKVLAMVLAGGKGERLYPLTEHRTKPAVPFGAIYRLVDFVLSNLLNSRIYQIYILTQYKAHSLIRHLQQGWVITQPVNGSFIIPVPAQMRARETWYLGTADAVYQNIYLIRKASPDLVLVFGADHVYFMDIRQMIDYHLEVGAEATVATIPMPLKEASRFGVAVVDERWRIRRFEEKIPRPTPIPDRPGEALVSMGNYIFDTQVLLEELERDAEDPESSHDFGRDILPKMCRTRRVYAYDFRTNMVPGSGAPADYWRDVGTIESYYQANMDLKAPLPRLNLYNPEWPVRSVRYHDPPAKVVLDRQGRMGHGENSLLAGGTVISGGYVRDSIIGRNTHIWSGAVVEESVILGSVEIGEGARIYRTIIDHGNVIPPGEEIGYDPEKDASRYFVDESGIVVIPRNPLY